MSGFGGMDSHQNMSSTGRELQEDPYGEEEGEADMEEQDAEPEQMDLNQEDSSQFDPSFKKTNMSYDEKLTL